MYLLSPGCVISNDQNVSAKRGYFGGVDMEYFGENVVLFGSNFDILRFHSTYLQVISSKILLEKNYFLLFVTVQRRVAKQSVERKIKAPR